MNWNYGKWWRGVALTGFVLEVLALAFLPHALTFFMVAIGVAFCGLVIPPGVDGVSAIFNTEKEWHERLWGFFVAQLAFDFALVGIALICFPFLMRISIIWQDSL